jgi:ADP-ribose pyrophosphatase
MAIHPSDGKKYEEVTLSKQTLYKGRIISLETHEVRLPGGGTAGREIVRHPGAVAVLALHDGKMLVVEQYRKPLERSQVEIPAGKLEPGEDPLESAKRELREETGYRAGRIRKIASFSTSPGFCDEVLHLYLAEDLMPGDSHPDEDEFLDCFAVTPEEAKRLMAEGRICDAKTILAVYAWDVYRLTGDL